MSRELESRAYLVKTGHMTVDLGRVQQSEPCACCTRPVTGFDDCGVHVRTWTLFCTRCAVRCAYTSPREVAKA